MLEASLQRAGEWWNIGTEAAWNNHPGAANPKPVGVVGKAVASMDALHVNGARVENFPT